MDNVWHVLDVIEGSPAESAGLVPMGDWVLGWSGGVLSQENDFYELVEAVSLTFAIPLPAIALKEITSTQNVKSVLDVQNLTFLL